MDLYIFDFDSTLFNSPDAPPSYKADWGSWGAEPLGLSPPYVPDEPGAGWWISTTLQAAQKATADPQTYTVLATGRDEALFSDRVRDLIAQQGLRFDEVMLNPGKDTGEYKREAFARILERGVWGQVHFWDDNEELLRSYIALARKFGIHATPHLIQERRRLPLSNKVAARALARKYLAGVLEPPPMMVQVIAEWALAQLAANARARLMDKTKSMRTWRKDHERDYTDILMAAAGLEVLIKAKSSPMQLRKAFEVLFKATRQWPSSLGSRSIRDFQKLSPEAYAALLFDLRTDLDVVREDVEGQLSFGETEIPILKKQMESYKPLLAPHLKVKPSDAPVIERSFPLDLTGWAYGDRADMIKAERIKAILSHIKMMEDQKEVMRGNPDSVKALNEMLKTLQDQLKKLEGIQGIGDVVKVRLKTQPARGDKISGSWNQHQKILTLIVNELENTRTMEARVFHIVRHELRHLSQSVLAESLGKFPSPQNLGGLPSKKIRDPIMDQAKARAQTSDGAAYQRKMRQRGVAPDEVYYLDDTEFQTWLADSIVDFREVLEAKARIKGGPLTQVEIKEHLMVWAGADTSRNPWTDPPSPFMRALKRHSPGKWRRAIKEIIRSVL